MTVVFVMVLVLVAVLLSAWLLIRQFRKPDVCAELRIELIDIGRQVGSELDRMTKSANGKSERLREGVALLEDVIEQLDALETRYRQALATGQISVDQVLVKEINLFRVGMQDARSKLVAELSRIS